MLSTRIILTLLPAFLTLTSASSHHRREDTYNDLTTTSTEVVYVTVTQTRTTDGTPYTVLVTPTPTTTTTSCTTSTTSTTTSCTTTDIEVPYPVPTTSTVIYHPYVNTTMKHTYAPSSGYTSTMKLNMTTYATVVPTGPPTQEGAAGKVGAKGVVVAAMGVVGAVVALL